MMRQAYLRLRVDLLAGVVDRLPEDFFEPVDVDLLAGAFFAGDFLAAVFLAAEVERLGLGLADLAFAGAFLAAGAFFAGDFLTDALRPLEVDAFLAAGEADLVAFFAAGFFVTLRERLAGATASVAAASATLAVGFVGLAERGEVWGGEREGGE